MRMMAWSVSGDLAAALNGDFDGTLMGLNAFFRTHSHWSAHGWYGDPSLSGLKEICDRVFADDSEDRRAFVRGLRHVAGVPPQGDDVPATISDRDVFWACLEALGRETGVVMPSRPPEGSGPSLRGH
jgi:hypothetical protein